MADDFNNFFTNNGTDLANKIPNASKPFHSYVIKVITSMKSQSQSTFESTRDAFFLLKINESSGHDAVRFNVIKQCFGELCKPLKYLFHLLIIKGMFPDDLETAKVTPINYRPISVL